jgi:hypothetical protein
MLWRMRKMARTSTVWTVRISNISSPKDLLEPQGLQVNANLFQRNEFSVNALYRGDAGVDVYGNLVGQLKTLTESIDLHKEVRAG